jgi:uncharacterized protein (TIGR00251 family)
MDYFKINGNTITLSLYIQPGSKKSEWMGLHDGTPKLKIAAQPIEGKANKEIIEFLSDYLDIPKSLISIKSGDTGRKKVIEIGKASEEIAAKLKNIGI